MPVNSLSFAAINRNTVEKASESIAASRNPFTPKCSPEMKTILNMSSISVVSMPSIEKSFTMSLERTKF